MVNDHQKNIFQSHRATQTTIENFQYFMRKYLRDCRREDIDVLIKINPLILIYILNHAMMSDNNNKSIESCISHNS